MYKQGGVVLKRNKKFKKKRVLNVAHFKLKIQQHQIIKSRMEKKSAQKSTEITYTYKTKCKQYGSLEMERSPNLFVYLNDEGKKQCSLEFFIKFISR